MSLCLWPWNNKTVFTVETFIWVAAERSTSKLKQCQVNLEYFFLEYKGVVHHKYDLSYQMMNKEYQAENLNTSPRKCISALFETCAAIFSKTQYRTPSSVSMQSRLIPLQLLALPKIEYAAQRTPIRHHRDVWDSYDECTKSCSENWVPWLFQKVYIRNGDVV